MYCKKCGRKLEEGLIYCPFCGADLKTGKTKHNKVKKVKEKSAKEEKGIYSILGFTFSLIGIFIPFLGSILGIVLSSLGLYEYKSMNDSHYKLASAGLIISITFLIIYLLLGTILLLMVFDVIQPLPGLDF